MKTKSKKVSVKDAKNNLKWAVIPIDKLPDNMPVIGIVQYVTKEAAKFALVEEVIVPVFEETPETQQS